MTYKQRTEKVVDLYGKGLLTLKEFRAELDMIIEEAVKEMAWDEEVERDGLFVTDELIEHTEVMAHMCSVCGWQTDNYDKYLVHMNQESACI